MRCPYCGTNVADGVAVCPSCNAALESPDSVSDTSAASQAYAPESAAQDAYAQPASGTFSNGPTPPGAQPSQAAPKSRKGLIGAVIAIVIALVAVMGLNYIGVLNIPFLPRSPEIALLKTFGGIVEDGDFFVSADADTDFDLSMKIAGQNADVDLDLQLYGDGKVSGFDPNDPLITKIKDGMFEANGMIGLELGSYGRQSQSFSAHGGYNLDLVEGVLNYSLIEPYSIRDSIKIDVDELRKNLEESNFDFDMSRIENLQVNGDTITFTLKAGKFDPSTLSDEQVEALSKIGIDPENLKVQASDYAVTVVNHEDQRMVTVNVVGAATVSMTGSVQALGAGEISIDGTVDVDTTITLRN